jgi:hypothetical protein
MPIDPSMPPAGAGYSTGTLNSQARTLQGGMPNEPMVTVDVTKSHKNVDPGTGAPRPYQQGSFVKTPSQAPMSVLLGQFDGFSVKQKRDLAERLVRGGFIPGPPAGMTLAEYVKAIPLDTVRAAYAALLGATAERNAIGQVNLTPMGLLNQHIDYNKEGFNKALSDANGDGIADDFTGVKKYKQTSIDIYSPSQARGLLRSVLQQELGRDPTDDEFDDFRSALNAEERENPSVSIQRTRYEDGEAVGSRTINRGGIDEAEYATQYAESQPGWAEWQAVGTYFPTILNTLGAGVPGV